MPVNPTYPGVYIEEVPSGVRTIMGVSTSIAAFIDFFKKGPMDKAVQILSLSDFEREFGGLDTKSEAGYAIQQFFLNGGTEAWVVRTASGTPLAAQYSILPGTALTVSAISAGTWGSFIRVAIDYNTVPAGLFNLVVSECTDSGGTVRVVRSEVFRNLSMESSNGRYVETVVNDDATGSKLVRVAASGGDKPLQNGTTSGDLGEFPALTSGNPVVGVTVKVGLDSDGPYAAQFGSKPTTLPEARTTLEAAIRAAKPHDPAFGSATVEVINNRLRVLAGPADPSVTVSFDDYPDSAYDELKFNAATNALRSGPVGTSIADPGHVVVKIGDDETTLDIDPFDSPETAQPALLAGLVDAGLTEVQVLLDEDEQLVVVPAEVDDIIAFAATSGDPDTVKALGLDGSRAVPGTMSGDLSSFPGLTNDPATVWATIGTTKKAVQLAGIKAGSGPAPTLADAKKALADGLASAFDPDPQVVLVDDKYLLVLQDDPTAPVTFEEYSGDDTTVDELLLNTTETTVAAQQYVLGGGADGSVPDATALIGTMTSKTGIYALEDVDLFNILCIPLTSFLDETQRSSVLSVAISYCAKRRAFFVVDPPDGINEVQEVKDWLDAINLPDKKNAALYFPRVKIADPLNEYRLRVFSPSGTIAGLYARTDGTRGVWKAPAGTDATLGNVQALECVLTDAQNGTLNPLGINCLRNFPVYGSVCWGARTLEGADQVASEWKYVPVRRLALFLEESLYRGTKWVVFEPNDEPLWSQIRLNVGAFMHNLFRQGAFQGTTPKDAYFVKCDKETTTQNDINLGIVNILVGFAPLKPAEFVIIKVQQMAGQVQA